MHRPIIRCTVRERVRSELHSIFFSHLWLTPEVLGVMQNDMLNNKETNNIL